MTFRRTLERAIRRTSQDNEALSRSLLTLERGLGRAQAAENAVMNLPGGAPTYQFRADTVTLSGGNVATIPNRRGADALVLSAGTLAAPAADVLFGGAQSIVFTGTQWLDSNLAASAWKFLHDGTGCTVVHVFAMTSLASARVLSSTGVGGASVPGHQAYVAANGSTAFSAINTAPSSYTASLAAATFAVNTPGALISAFGTSPFTAVDSGTQGGVAVLNSAAFAPSAANPFATFRLGAYADGSFPASMRWCETLIFPRVLHEYERQIVREYIAARYAIAAPSLTGAWRRLMARLPFSLPAADTFNTSGGNATAFLDRARPGHSFANSNVPQQVLNPVADANFLNAFSADFVGSKWYLSTLAAGAWKFVHDGTGFDLFHIATPTNLAAGSRVSLSTQTALTNANRGMSLYTFGAGSYFVVSDGAAATATGQFGSLTTAPTYRELSYGSAASPNFDARIRGSSLLSGAQSGSPSASDPASSLRLGCVGAGASTAVEKWAASLIFNRVLSAADRAATQADILELFGQAA